jgi:hypothetical protein
MASMNPNPFPMPVQHFAAPVAPPAQPPVSAPVTVAPTAIVAPVFDPTQTQGPMVVPVEPEPSPDASGGIRAVRLTLRRAELRKVVRGVVLASLLVCVAAVGRGAIAAVTSEPEARSPAPSLRAREDVVHPVLRPEVDSLSDRTLRAMAEPAKRPMRATASRHRRW